MYVSKLFYVIYYAFYSRFRIDLVSQIKIKYYKLITFFQIKLIWSILTTNFNSFVLIIIKSIKYYYNYYFI